MAVWKHGRVAVLIKNNSSEWKVDKNLEMNETVLSAHYLSDAILILTESGKLSKVSLDDFTLESITDFGLGLKCSAISPISKRYLAIGGEKHDLKVFDLSLKKFVFEAKNLPNDKFDLAIPIHIRSILFDGEPEEIAGDKQSMIKFKLLTGTQFGEIRYYESANGSARPLGSFKLGTKSTPITMLISSTDPDHFIFSKQAGPVEVLKISKGSDAGKSVKGVKIYGYTDSRPTGSIVDVMRANRRLITISADRFVYIHNLKTRKLVSKTYLGHIPTCVDLSPIDEHEEERSRSEDVEATAEDKLWDRIPKVNLGAKRQKLN